MSLLSLLKAARSQPNETLSIAARSLSSAIRMSALKMVSLVGAAGLLAAVPSSAQQLKDLVPKQAPAEATQRNGGADYSYRNSYDSVLAVRIIEDDDNSKRRQASEAAADRYQQRELDAQRQSVQAGLAQAVFGFLGIILLFLTLVYTARAANAARRSADQAGVALDLTITAANAATRSADAAERAISSSQDQFNASSRPWVMVQPKVGIALHSIAPDITGQREPTDLMLFYAEIRNIGQTPATNAQVRTALSIVEDPTMEPVFDLEDWSTVPGGVIAPSQDAQAGRRFMSEADANAVYGKTKAAYFLTEILYDIPGMSKKGHTISSSRLHLHTDFTAIIGGNMSGVILIAQKITDMV